VLTILYLPTGLMGIPERIRPAARGGKRRAKKWHRALVTRAEAHKWEDHDDSHMLRRLWPLGGSLVRILGAGSPAGAEELRIGYLAPDHRHLRPVGKDMVDGFQLYLDEVKATSAAPR
jgi:hypothetical protein